MMQINLLHNQTCIVSTLVDLIMIMPEGYLRLLTQDHYITSLRRLKFKPSITSRVGDYFRLATGRPAYTDFDILVA